MRKCLTCRKVSAELDTHWDTIRLWFFNWFHQDIIDLSQDRYTQGISDGYKLGFDKCQELASEKQHFLMDEIKELQGKLHSTETIHTMVLQTPDKQSILTVQKDQKTGATLKLLLGKEEIPPQLLSALKVEAGALSNMSLWKVFQETLKDQAHQIMFEKSETFEDLRSGKMMLYNLDVQKNIVDLLQNLKLEDKS